MFGYVKTEEVTEYLAGCTTSIISLRVSIHSDVHSCSTITLDIDNFYVIYSQILRLCDTHSLASQLQQLFCSESYKVLTRQNCIIPSDSANSRHHLITFNTNLLKLTSILNNIKTPNIDGLICVSKLIIKYYKYESRSSLKEPSYRGFYNY